LRLAVLRFRILDFGLRIAAAALSLRPASVPAARQRVVVVFSGMVVLAAVVLPGCREEVTTPGRQSPQAMMRRADRGEALLNAAASQLSDLASAVDTELRPPAVILDSSKSANGADVMAVCTPTPTDPDGPITLITVPAGNARFRSLSVRSGDIVKYYLLADETIDEERRQAGFASQLAMEFSVAQVLDENALLIEKGIPPSVANDYMQQVINDETLLDDQAMPPGVLIPAKIEIWRNLDDRLIEINEKLVLYADRRLPPIGWQPSPDEQVISQIVAWLNQWLRQSEPGADWEPDLLLQTLDAELSADEALAPFISPETLASQVFASHDGRLLQEAVWHRDISRWAQGDNFNEVVRATALFDWVVRNVQLVADTDGAVHRPWQVLLHGRGTAAQRAWVFALLCRQQGLDIVILASATGDANWLPALFVNKQLYLFDPRLGLPVPGPGGESVATLQQARADDGLLRKLDLEGAPYPITSDQLKDVVPHLVADPFDLTQRARQVESNLTGDDHLVLTSQPSELAARLKTVSELKEARLWGVPFRTLRDQLLLGRAARHRAALAFEPFAVRPHLWKARALHFQGRRTPGDESQEDALDDHREAAQLYTSKSVRPTDREIAQTESLEKRRVDEAAKRNATYWIGLLSLDDGRYDVAAHWLGRPELNAAESAWQPGARYNLARTLEAQGNLDEAIKLLEADDSSAQQHGNRLRAERLKAKQKTTKKNTSLDSP
jgi:tetratricopeptide (TPR) repeat protein